MAVFRRLVLGVMALSFILSLTLTPAFVARGQTDDDPEVCEQVTDDIMTQIGVNCAQTAVGTVCYASPDSSAEGTEISFAEAGDTADAALVSRLVLAPLDLDAEVWGTSTLNLQANLPPGFADGARIIAFGGVEMENALADDELFQPLDSPLVAETSADTSLRAPVLGNPRDAEVIAEVDAGTEVTADAISEDGRWVRVVVEDSTGWIPAGAMDAIDRQDLPVYGNEALTAMQAFHFRSEDIHACSSLSSGLLIQGHEDYPIDLIVNDVPIRIESTIFLRTRTDASTGEFIMDLFVLFGLARVNADTDAEIIVPPGFSLSILYNHQPGDFDIDDARGITPAISFSTVLPLTREILEALAFLLDIPGGTLFYLFDLPIISQPSGVGGVIIQIRFVDQNAAVGANELCQAGVLAEDICAILGF